MLNRVTLAAFADELEKLSAVSTRDTLIGVGGLIGGGALGAMGKDYMQDAAEGRTLRKEREFQQKQQMHAMSKGIR
jgi:hypothetical protein